MAMAQSFSNDKSIDDKTKNLGFHFRRRPEKKKKGAPGFEPGTYRSAVDCSTTELYPQLREEGFIERVFFRRILFVPSELDAHIWWTNKSPQKQSKHTNEAGQARAKTADKRTQENFFPLKLLK